jgi:hypothetical protein
MHVAHCCPYLCQSFAYGEVRGSNPHGLHKILTHHNQGATWQPTPGPRGTIPFDNNMPRVKTHSCPHVCHLNACQLSIIPCHHFMPCHCPCPISTLPHHQTVWTVQSTTFFCLFGKSNRTRYLTHLMSV